MKNQKVGEIQSTMGARQTVLVKFSTRRHEANEYVQRNGNIDRAFGAMSTFNDMPLESQAMIQEIVNRFENEVKQPFTKEMQSTLATLDAARGKQPASVTKAVKAAATSLAQQYARV